MRLAASDAIKIYNNALLTKMMEIKIFSKSESEWQVLYYKGSKVNFFCDGTEISTTYVMNGRGVTEKYFAVFEGSKLSFDLEQVLLSAEDIIEKALKQLVS